MATTIATHKTCDLYAAFWEGKFQGKAKCKVANIEVARVTGASIDDVLEKLRKIVDETDIEELHRRRIIEKHGEFLRSRGIDISHASAQELVATFEREHRAAHCYGCLETVSNLINLECGRCKWIICGGCGACGCGHPIHGPKITERVERQGRVSRSAQSSKRVFGSFAEASKHAKALSGARITRTEDGQAWVVEALGSEA